MKYDRAVSLMNMVNTWMLVFCIVSAAALVFI
jgi:hypothetical protein